MKKIMFNAKRTMRNIVWFVLGMITMLVILNLGVDVTPYYDHVETTINGTLVRAEDKLVGIEYDILWNNEIVVSF